MKERGFQNAGLYNPHGVGGTHVMYVLQARRPARARRPAQGSDDQPDGVAVEGRRQAAGGGRAWSAALVAGFFHYMKVGPIEVEEDEKEEERT